MSTVKFPRCEPDDQARSPKPSRTRHVGLRDETREIGQRRSRNGVLALRCDAPMTADRCPRPGPGDIRAASPVIGTNLTTIAFATTRGRRRAIGRHLTSDVRPRTAHALVHVASFRIVITGGVRWTSPGFSSNSLRVGSFAAGRKAPENVPAPPRHLLRKSPTLTRVISTTNAPKRNAGHPHRAALEGRYGRDRIPCQADG